MPWCLTTPCLIWMWHCRVSSLYTFHDFSSEITMSGTSWDSAVIRVGWAGIEEVGAACFSSTISQIMISLKLVSPVAVIMWRSSNLSFSSRFGLSDEIQPFFLLSWESQPFFGIGLNSNCVLFLFIIICYCFLISYRFLRHEAVITVELPSCSEGALRWCGPVVKVSMLVCNCRPMGHCASLPIFFFFVFWGWVAGRY